MQKLLSRKEKKDSLSVGFNRESFLQHWNTPISGKFTLLDWYWLLEDEADDLYSLTLSENYCSLVVQHSFDAYIDKNIIPYTLHKTQEEILQLFRLTKKYPDTLKPKIEELGLDLIEPSSSEIDSYASGWPKSIYDPTFAECEVASRRSRFNVEIETTSDLSDQKSKESLNDGLILSNNVANKNGKKGINKKRMLSATGVRKRRMTTTFRSPFVERKSKKLTTVPVKVKDSTKQIPQEKKQIHLPAKNVSIVVPPTPRGSSSSQFSEVRESVHSLIAEEHLKKLKLLKLNRHISGKTLPGLELKTTIPSSITFDHLDPSNFPFTRSTKTGYSIKDVEIVKEPVKMSTVKRVVVAPKKIITDGDSAKSSIDSAAVQHPYVFSMPSVADKMTNLGGAVLVRKDVNYKIPTSTHPSLIEIEHDERSQLKPISPGKINPRLVVSELIDRIPGPTRIPKD